MSLPATANDVDGDTLTYTWTFTTTGGPGTVCNATGAGMHAATLTLLCNDDAVVKATVTVSDGVNAPVSDSTTLTVGNVTPVAGAVVQQPTAPVGDTVAISTAFSDPGTNDTHTATIDWGDSTTSAGTVSETAGGTVTGSHLYATDNHYTVTVTITDDDGGVATVSGSVLSDTTPPVITSTVAPAPNGAGWNNSPATVSWTTVDPLAPITATTGCDPTTRSTDTPFVGVTYTCTATSAGGTSSKSTTVKVDQTAPTLTGAPTTSPNPNGWYNGPVIVDWTLLRRAVGHRGIVPGRLDAELGRLDRLGLRQRLRRRRQHHEHVECSGEDRHARAGDVGVDVAEWNNTTVTLSLTRDRQPVGSRHDALHRRRRQHPDGHLRLADRRGRPHRHLLEHRQRRQRRDAATRRR